MPCHMMFPQARMALPAKAGAVRDLRISGRMAAVATQGAGLVLMSTATDNVVASFDAGMPIWSCCWSQRNDQQVCLQSEGGSVYGREYVFATVHDVLGMHCCC